MFKSLTNFGVKCDRKPHKQRKSFRLEALEDRQLMAGDLYIASQPLIRFDVIGADVRPPVTTRPGENAPTDPPRSAPPPDVFNLSSKPGAAATLYLDFDGIFASQKPSGWDGYEFPEYSKDLNATFDYNEKWEMYNIWASVAEDYSPFNINVTTVDPGNFANGSRNLRVTIGGTDPDGGSRGGFSDYDNFTDGAPNIAHAFAQTATSGANIHWMNIADTVSHEAGHAFGLRHYAPSSLGNEFKRPLMAENGPNGPAGPFGTIGSAERGTWWKGRIKSSYYDDTVQDDMATIANRTNGFGYSRDDHGGTIATATRLQMSNPSDVLQAKGIIEKMSDADMFYFETGGGNVSVKIGLPQSYHPNNAGGEYRNIGNLDATLQLFNDKGVLLAKGTDPTLQESLSANLAAGRYYVRVGSYGLYGDVGQYTVTVDETSGPWITHSRVEAVNATTSKVWVTFNETIDVSTFTRGDVYVPGCSVISVQEPIDGKGREFAITISKPAATNRLDVQIYTDIKDAYGNRLDQNRNGLNGEAVDMFMATFTLKEINTGPTVPGGPIGKLPTGGRIATRR